MNYASRLLGAAILAAFLSQGAYAVDFVVDSTLDAVDSNPGDGACASASDGCTLRAAVMEANSLPGADRIDLTGINDPNNPITLTIVGVDETFQETSGGAAPCEVVVNADASTGDLDVTQDLEVFGAGPALTIIRWANKGLVEPAVGDRIFHVQAPTGATVNLVSFSDLTMRDGSVGILNDTTAENPYNCAITTQADVTTYWQFRRFGGALAVGPGAAIVEFQESASGSGSGGAGGEGGSGGPPTGGETEGGITAVTLNRVAVLANQSGSDAGGMMMTAASAITDSVISGNESGGNAGGVYIDAATTVSGTLIGTSSSDVPYASGALAAALLGAANVGENGGAIFDTGSHTTEITASAINGNEAIGGGGVAVRSGVTMNISNTTVSGNTGSDVGGGLTTNGTVNLTNTTIANNLSASDAPGGGAGLNSFGSGTYTLVNTILTGNIVQGAEAARDANCGCSGGAAQCPPGKFVTIGTNLEDANTCSFLPEAGDLIDTDPLLSPLANNGGLTETHALPSVGKGDPATSPAIDAGESVRCPNVDQRGGVRPADGNLDGTAVCDIGAFELYIPKSDIAITGPAAGSVDLGDPINLAYVVANNGVDAATGVTLTLPLPANVAFVSATPSVGTCAAAGSTLTCSVGAVAVGATVNVAVTLNTVDRGVANFAAAVNADQFDPDESNNTTAAAVTIVANSDLALTATTSATAVKTKATYTVTLQVLNNGPQAATGVTVSANVPSQVSVSAGAGCTVAGATLTCAVADLAVGATSSFSLTFTALTAGTATVTAQASSGENDPVPANNTATAVVTISKSGGGGGGGCAYAPGGVVDPTLPLVLLGALAALYRRRLTKEMAARS